MNGSIEDYVFACIENGETTTREGGFLLYRPFASSSFTFFGKRANEYVCSSVFWDATSSPTKIYVTCATSPTAAKSDPANCAFDKIYAYNASSSEIDTWESAEKEVVIVTDED